MKKTAVLMFVLSLLFLTQGAYAADEKSDAASTASTPAAAPAVTEPTAAPAANPATPAPPEAAATGETSATAAPAAPSPATVNENLEFVSGEVSGVDEATKTLKVKLYGETENTATNKEISVTTDESTDITDGEKDRDLKSLTAGTEVDVEYDPATNKATYIFVY